MQQPFSAYSALFIQRKTHSGSHEPGNYVQGIPSACGLGLVNFDSESSAICLVLLRRWYHSRNYRTTGQDGLRQHNQFHHMMGHPVLKLLEDPLGTGPMSIVGTPCTKVSVKPCLAAMNNRISPPLARLRSSISQTVSAPELNKLS